MTEHIAHGEAAPGQTEAEAAQAAKEHLHRQIKAKHNNLVDVKPMKFSFKTDKELGVKRATVELDLPVLSMEGLVYILQNEDGKQDKAQALIFDALAEVVYDQARSLVNAKEDINQENFPLDQVSWDFIANMPKAERRGGGISKETWDEFAEDFATVMQAAAAKKPEQAALAAKILSRKFQEVKTNKPVIKTLQTQLGIYITATANGEQFADCVEFLNKKAETLLAVNDEDLLANL